MDKSLDRQIAQVSNEQASEESRLKDRLDQLREEIGTIAADLEHLTTVLAPFETRYDASVGVLFVELDDLELAIAEYRRRLRLSETMEWETVESEVRREFAAERERIQSQYNETSEARNRERALPPNPSPHEAQDIRRIYRQLARRFHPDLAANPEQREYFGQQMRRINEAMENNNLDALVRLDIELPLPKDHILGETAGARIAWMASRVAKLENVLHSLTSKLSELKSSSLYRLWKRCEDDSNTFNKLRDSLRGDIQERRQVLETLIVQYRQQEFNKLQ